MTCTPLRISHTAMTVTDRMLPYVTVQVLTAVCAKAMEAQSAALAAKAARDMVSTLL